MFRGRWRGVVLLAILIGAAGGGVLTAWEGARRTQSALPRMLHATHAADVSVAANVDITRLEQHLDFSGLADLPQVAHAGKLYGFGITPWTAHTLDSQDFGAYSTAPDDQTVGRTFDAPLLIDGRFPAADRPDEVVVNDAAIGDFRQQGFSARLGTRVPLAWFNFAVLNTVTQSLGDRVPTQAEIDRVFHVFDGRIVGRVRLPTDVAANQNQSNPAILLGPAFAHQHARDASYSVASIALRDPAQLGPFEVAARARYPSAGLRFSTPSNLLASFTAITQPYVDALRLFAIIAAITTALVLGARPRSSGPRRGIGCPSAARESGCHDETSRSSRACAAS